MADYEDDYGGMEDDVNADNEYLLNDNPEEYGEEDVDNPMYQGEDEDEDGTGFEVDQSLHMQLDEEVPAVVRQRRSSAAEFDPLMRRDSRTEQDGFTVMSTADGTTALPNGTSSKPMSERITTRYLTKYERARLLGARALQLSMNAPPLVELRGETDALQIAQRELKERKLPLVIRRYLPDNSYEDWTLDELIID